MRSIHHFERIYIHREFVDMRKSINGLTQIVVNNLKLDIKANALFVFTNKRRTHLKILYFDKSGFALWLKRLESSKFSWPKDKEGEVVEINEKDMEMLLQGINLWTKFEEVDFDYTG